MSKALITKKDIKKRFNKIIRVGAGDMQHLLRGIEPFAYSARGDLGWACDYYQVEGVCISSGYDCIGEEVDWELVHEYEEKARVLWHDYTYNYMVQLDKVTKLLHELMSKI